MITQTDAWLAEMGQSHLVAFAAAVWALFACMANAGAPPNVLRGPFNPPNVNIAPDLNLAIDYVMSSPNQCGVTRLRRNGMIYSHKELYEGLQKEGLSLLELNKTSRYYYPDDINCTFTVCVGTGWQVQLLFPIGLQLECATDNSTCDCLEVYDGYTTDAPLIRKLCGGNNVVKPIQSSHFDLTLRFFTDRNCKTSLGFQVKWYSFRPNVVPCTNEEFACDKNRCIPKYFLCDDTYHCFDKTDEGSTGCSEEQQICRMVTTFVRYKRLWISILVLLLLITVLTATLCVYYVSRMRKIHVACTRVLAVQGTRKPENGCRKPEDGGRGVISPTNHVITPCVGRSQTSKISYTA